MKKFLKFAIVVIIIAGVAMFFINKSNGSTGVLPPTLEFTKIENTFTKTTAYVDISHAQDKTLYVEDFTLKFNNTDHTAVDIYNSYTNTTSHTSVTIYNSSKQTLKIEFVVLINFTNSDAILYYKGKEIKVGGTLVLI